jgi:ribosomal-protein-alanine N-acetyltransferase
VGGGARPAVAGRVTGGSFLVRRAEARDIPEILRIERSSFADPWSADAFFNSLIRDTMRFLVAIEGGDSNGERGSAGVLMGYVIALFLTEEAEIADLAVSSAARRRGVGRLLLDQVAREAASEGAHSLFLEVRESNVGARALYEALAFAQVGRRKGYYRDPVEDALLLRRELVPG